jgi:hypothetical protein
MLITRINPITGKNVSIDLPVTQRQLARWEEGELIQNVFPNLTSDQREFLLTGCTASEWDKLTNDVCEHSQLTELDYSALAF